MGMLVLLSGKTTLSSENVTNLRTIRFAQSQKVIKLLLLLLGKKIMIHLQNYQTLCWHKFLTTLAYSNMILQVPKCFWHATNAWYYKRYSKL